MKTFVMDMLGLLCVAIAMMVIMFSIFGCNKTNPLNKQKPVSTQVTVLVFTASWCGPCHNAINVISDTHFGRDGRVLVRVYDIDDNPQITQKYRITRVPTILVYVKSKQILRTNNVFVAIRAVRNNLR